MMYPLVSELAVDGVPVTVTCRVLKLVRQDYYRWLAAPITASELEEAYLANALFDGERGIFALDGVVFANLRPGRYRRAVAARSGGHPGSRSPPPSSPSGRATGASPPWSASRRPSGG